ncbi:MAG: TrbI/VirB10 family protein [Hyphomonadaceae bacterium]|nr:TrbI/VirB10 family protein [Hyphomonadaceae bacterium]
MADGLPPRPDAGADEPPPQEPASPTEPAQLDAIRVKAPGARGLNKPAILTAAGGGVAVVLLLASGAFSSNQSTKPATTKPMMSDPARPEMAQGAIKALPADYAQAAALEAQQADRAPASFDQAGPPQLGPPLPGDIAAFAQAQPVPGDMPAYSNDWSTPAAYAPPEALDPAIAEAAAADRSGIFFALRDEPREVDTASAQPIAYQTPQRSPLTAVAPQDRDQPASATYNDRVLFPGTVISASLITDLNSESPGPVIAQVTQTIYDSATGRIALIPQGARLMGEYRSSSRYGQSRVAIIWSRLIMPDGDEVALDEVGADPSGAAGVKGEVDNHWGDVFGAAALGTTINVGVATTEEPQLTYNGIGAISRDPVDAAIADGVQRSAGGVTNRVVDRGLAIPPTIRVGAGTRISIIVTRRIGF